MNFSSAEAQELKVLGERDIYREIVKEISAHVWGSHGARKFTIDNLRFIFAEGIPLYWKEGICREAIIPF